MISRTVDASLPNPNGDTMRKDTACCLLAEFIGTFLLIFAGAGAVVLADLGIGSLVSIMFAHALVIMVMTYAHGDISGSIINPAATLGLFAAGAIERVRVLPFIVVQLAGDGEDSERRHLGRGHAGHRSRRYGRRYSDRHPLQDGGPSP